MKKNIIIAVLAAMVSYTPALNAQTKSKTATQKLDRSQKPKSGPAPKISIGNYESFKLDNGLSVIW
jgi:hypothetical protein